MLLLLQLLFLLLVLLLGEFILSFLKQSATILPSDLLIKNNQTEATRPRSIVQIIQQPTAVLSFIFGF